MDCLVSDKGTHTSNNNVLLSIRGVRKRFGDLQALSGASLETREGEIYGPTGPNGVDKITFFNVIMGLYTPDAGEFMLGGTPCQPAAVHEVARAGIVHTLQNICLFSDMVVVEDVMVDRHVCIKTGLIGAVFHTKAVHEEEQFVEGRAHDPPDYIGIGKYTDYTARNLSYGHQRRLKVARALATQPKLLALDGPATGANATEKVELRGLFDKIRSGGKTILLIEHDVKLVMGLCSRLTVLDYGKVIVQGLPREAQSNPAVIEIYFDASAC